MLVIACTAAGSTTPAAGLVDAADGAAAAIVLGCVALLVAEGGAVLQALSNTARQIALTLRSVILNLQKRIEWRHNGNNRGQP